MVVSLVASRGLYRAMSDMDAAPPATDAVITCLSLFDSFSAMAYLDGSCR